MDGCSSGRARSLIQTSPMGTKNPLKPQVISTAAVPEELNIKATNSSFKTLGWSRSPGENHLPPSPHSSSKVLQKPKSSVNSQSKTVPEGCLGPKAWTKRLSNWGNSDFSWIRQQLKLTQAVGGGGAMKPKFPKPQ